MCRFPTCLQNLIPVKREKKHIDCRAFTDILSRRSEHLDNEIIVDLHPQDGWIGHVATGKFPAEQGVSHTFDRFNQVWPDLSSPWTPITTQGCVGNPCDPPLTKIGMGFTRYSYQLFQRTYGTDLFCFPQILSADRAKEQFAHVVETLRRSTSIIHSHRARLQALQWAGQQWSCAANGLQPIGQLGVAAGYWDPTQTIYNLPTLPTSKITAKHLMRRVHPQILLGALRRKIVGNKYQSDSKDYGSQPMLEFAYDMEGIWEITEGNPELTDHWRYSEFNSTDAKAYYKYGWQGSVGNYGIRPDVMPLRFTNLQTQNADGTHQLQLIFPYTNVNATEGIKEQPQQIYQDAPIQVNFIWHRMVMIKLTRESTSINPEMPFAMLDFGGKWMFAMNNLGDCLQSDGLYHAIDNSWGNKGRFQSWFSDAYKVEYPELAEVFWCLREPACIVDSPRCAPDPGYPAVSYASANAPCAPSPIVITELPVLNPGTSTYEIAMNTITCNGLQVVHAPVTGTATLAALVAQMNTVLAALGTWSVSGNNIQLTTSACANIGLPWSVS
jgi:hypothetical protein